MGNSNSMLNDENFIIKVNDTYANILLNLNIIEIEKLTESKKCNDNVILLQDLLKKNDVIFLNKIHKQIYNNKSTNAKKYLLCKEIANYYIKIANIYASIKTVFNKKTNRYCENILEQTKIDNLTDIKNLFKNVCNQKYGIFSKTKLNYNRLDNRHNLLDISSNLKEEEQKYFLNKRFDIFEKDFDEIYNIFSKNEDKQDIEDRNIGDIEDRNIGDILIDYGDNNNQLIKHTCDVNNNNPVIIKDYTNHKKKIQNVIKNIVLKHSKYGEILSLSRKIKQEQSKLIKILETIFTKTKNELSINKRLNNELVDKLTLSTRNSLKIIYTSCYEIYIKAITLISDILKNYSGHFDKIDNEADIKKVIDKYNDNLELENIERKKREDEESQHRNMDRDRDRERESEEKERARAEVRAQLRAEVIEEVRAEVRAEREREIESERKTLTKISAKI
jgi:hypothetical protein